jgi:predicted metalloprotease
MSFNENVTLDTSQVSSGGRGGGAPGGMVVGGGIGGIIMLILAMVFGINPSDITGGGDQPVPGQVQSGGEQDAAAFAECVTGADANTNVECRVIGSVNSVQAFWAGELPRFGKQWQPTQTVLYRGTTQSACGTASNQVGPFYCPLDKKVYIDASFFQILEQQFGSSAGPWHRSTSSPTSTGTPCRTSLGCSAAHSRTRRARSPAPFASNSWPTASAGCGPTMRPPSRMRTPGSPS